MSPNLLSHARRIFDRRPWAAHLYVTDRCNLDCHYCNEYDNGVPHPPLGDLQRRMDKIRALGVVRLGLQGGEPLLHPDIVEVVRHARSLGFEPVSLATNGFLLSRDQLGRLEDAGLHSMNISVDRMTPIESTRKSLKTVLEKLDWFSGTRVRLAVSGVLTHDTLGEMRQVIQACLDKGVAVHARVVHDDLVHGRELRTRALTAEMLAFLEHEEDLKRRGEKIHTSWGILEYQKRMLRQQPQDWTCVAGYKYFFVSAQGKFWLCSQIRTPRDIMDITPADLEAYQGKKDCQANCGIYCTVDASLLVNRPLSYLWTEARGRAAGMVHRWRSRRAPRPTRVAAPR
jgi:MoaA/NifB/PqqE/SkfB family radical SAM enzyme